MSGQAGFWDIDKRYERLRKAGDPLEKLNTLVPWEVFRKPLMKALKRSDGAKGGRPAFDPDVIFRMPSASVPTFPWTNAASRHRPTR